MKKYLPVVAIALFTILAGAGILAWTFAGVDNTTPAIKAAASPTPTPKDLYRDEVCTTAKRVSDPKEPWGDARQRLLTIGPLVQDQEVRTAVEGLRHAGFGRQLSYTEAANAIVSACE